MCLACKALKRVAERSKQVVLALVLPGRRRSLYSIDDAEAPRQTRCEQLNLFPVLLDKDNANIYRAASASRNNSLSSSRALTCFFERCFVLMAKLAEES